MQISNNKGGIAKTAIQQSANNIGGSTNKGGNSTKIIKTGLKSQIYGLDQQDDGIRMPDINKISAKLNAMTNNRYYQHSNTAIVDQSIDISKQRNKNTSSKVPTKNTTTFGGTSSSVDQIHRMVINEQLNAGGNSSQNNKSSQKHSDVKDVVMQTLQGGRHSVDMINQIKFNVVDKSSAFQTNLDNFYINNKRRSQQLQNATLKPSTYQRTNSNSVSNVISSTNSNHKVDESNIIFPIMTTVGRESSDVVYQTTIIKEEAVVPQKNAPFVRALNKREPVINLAVSPVQRRKIVSKKNKKYHQNNSNNYQHQQHRQSVASTEIHAALKKGSTAESTSNGKNPSMTNSLSLHGQISILTQNSKKDGETTSQLLADKIINVPSPQKTNASLNKRGGDNILNFAAASYTNHHHNHQSSTKTKQQHKQHKQLSRSLNQTSAAYQSHPTSIVDKTAAYNANPLNQQQQAAVMMHMLRDNSTNNSSAANNYQWPTPAAILTSMDDILGSAIANNNMPPLPSKTPNSPLKTKLGNIIIDQNMIDQDSNFIKTKANKNHHKTIDDQRQRDVNDQADFVIDGMANIDTKQSRKYDRRGSLTTEGSLEQQQQQQQYQQKASATADDKLPYLAEAMIRSGSMIIHQNDADDHNGHNNNNLVGQYNEESIKLIKNSESKGAPTKQSNKVCQVLENVVSKTDFKTTQSKHLPGAHSPFSKNNKRRKTKKQQQQMFSLQQAMQTPDQQLKLEIDDDTSPLQQDRGQMNNQSSNNAGYNYKELFSTQTKQNVKQAVGKNSIMSSSNRGLINQSVPNLKQALDKHYSQNNSINGIGGSKHNMSLNNYSVDQQQQLQKFMMMQGRHQQHNNSQQQILMDQMEIGVGLGTTAAPSRSRIQQQISELNNGSVDTSYLLFPFIGKTKQSQIRSLGSRNENHQTTSGNQNISQLPQQQQQQQQQQDLSSGGSDAQNSSRRLQLKSQSSNSLGNAKNSSQQHFNAYIGYSKTNKHDGSNKLTQSQIKQQSQKYQQQLAAQQHEFNGNPLTRNMIVSQSSVFGQHMMSASEPSQRNSQPQRGNIIKNNQKQQQAMQKRSKKASEYSLNRCEITLSQHNQAPAIIAGPGNQTQMMSFSGPNTPVKQQESSAAQSSMGMTSQQQKQHQSLFEKLSKINMTDVIKEQRRRHPELNQLSTESLNKMLIQHIIQLKQTKDKTVTDKNRSSVGGGSQTSGRPAATSGLGAGEYGTNSNGFLLADSDIEEKASSVGGHHHSNKLGQQKATQIVNHFNITINHQTGGVQNQPTDNSYPGSQQQQQQLSYNELQKIMLARDQAFQSAMIQQQQQHNSLSDFGVQEDQVNFTRKRQGQRRSSEVISLQEDEFNQQAQELQQELLLQHQRLVPNLSQSRFSPMIRLKNPRVKRRPALNTNLQQSRPGSKNAVGNVPGTLTSSNNGHQQHPQQLKSSVQPVQRSNTLQSAEQKLTTHSNTVQKVNHKNATETNGAQQYVTTNNNNNTAVKRQFTTQLKAIVNPRVNLSSLNKPNCQIIKEKNKVCQQKRKELRDERGPNYRSYASLDVLVITFEGVLGSFLPLQPELQDQLREQKTNTLILRPGISLALNELVKNFKIAIITRDQSTIRQKQILKALSKEQVPFDAFFQIILVDDNLFTYQTILRELDSSKMQAIFLTSVNFSLNMLRDQTKQKFQKSKPEEDFSLMPITSGMEQIVIMCITHLLKEINFDEETVELNKSDILPQNLVCDMTAVSTALNDFFNVANNLTQSEQVKQQREKALNEAKDKQKKSRANTNNKPNNESGKNTPRNTGNTVQQNQELKTTKQKFENPAVKKKSTIQDAQSISSQNNKAPPKRLSNFQLLTNLIDNQENLYPITFFQKKVESQRKLNTFVKAFEKAQAMDLFAMNYEQPQHYSKLILGKRLEDSMMRIRSKLLKIKQAMKNVAHKETQSEEKSFRVSQKTYELHRKQPAYIAFQKYNSHYFSEIYDECQVRLPCHPSKDQFEKLSSIYRSLQSRLDNLINNTFPFSQSGQSCCYYSLMLFKGHLFQQEPVQVAGSSQRRQYELKESYWIQTQTMLNDLNNKENASASVVLTTNKPGKIESPGRGGSNTNTGAANITSADPQQIITKPSSEEKVASQTEGGTEQQDEAKQSQQAQQQQKAKGSQTAAGGVERKVPDLISWLSEKQPVFSFTNALPKNNNSKEPNTAGKSTVEQLSMSCIKT